MFIRVYPQYFAKLGCSPSRNLFNKSVLATDQTGAALASGTFGKLSWRTLIYQQIMPRQMKIITIMIMIMKIIMTVYNVDLKYLKQ